MGNISFDEAKQHNEAIKHAFDAYNQMGFKCLPVEAGSKVVRIKGWQERSFTKDEFKGLANIGVQLGSVSNNLVDIDLDNPVARKIAKLFLPKTSWRFGRVYENEGDGVIASHWLYHVQGDVKSSADWRLSKKETGGAVVKVMEYRGENSQTVFPPSKHHAQVEWVEQGDSPATVEDKELKQALGIIMTVIWVHANIAPGVFHDAMLRVIGGFVKAGIDIEVTKCAVSAICFLTEQDGEDDRLREVDDTYKKVADGKVIAGFSSLEVFGWECDRIKKWLPSKFSESGKVAKDGKPKINISRVCMEDAVQECVKIIDAVKDADKRMFSYGGRGVVVVKREGNRYNDVQVIAPNNDAFAHHLEHYIQFVRTDGKEHVDVLVEAEPRLVRRMMDPSINWGMPQLEGVVMYPLLLTTGKMLTNEGFCRESGLFIGDNLGITEKEVHEMSLEDAKANIIDVYDDFPFHNRDVGMSLSVTALLSAVARKSIRISPMFIATSPYPQDGKTEWSFIPQLVLTKTTTNYAFGRTEEEQQKQLVSYFMNDPSVMMFDNQNGKFHSQALTELLTSGSFIGRLLGTNDQVCYRPKTLIIANGINVAPSSEIATRSIIVEFDRRRTMNFKYPRLREHVLSKQRDILKSALKLLMNGITAPTVEFEGGPSRFLEWDGFVRKAVVAAGFVDPMRTDLKSRVLDDDGEARETFLEWLFKQFPPGSKFKSLDIFTRVGLDYNLENTIKAIARRGTFSTIVVGTAINVLRGAEYQGFRLSWASGGKGLMMGRWKEIDTHEND
jgi:hypothetical protein